MLHAKFQDQGLLVLEMKIFTIYGHGGLLGQVPCTIYINFLSHFSREIHMKFDIDCPIGFRDV